MLGNILRKEFDPIIRSRGAAYFSSGAVVLDKVDREPQDSMRDVLAWGGYQSLTFKVRGSELYNTSIEFDPSANSYDLKCTCPYFQSGDHCKHLWAVILFCDKRGYFAKVKSVFGNAHQTMESRSSETQSNSWMQRLQSAELRVNHERNSRQSRLNVIKDQTPKIGTYILDVTESQKQNKICLRLFVQERLKKGTLGSLKEANLTQEKVQQYADPLEKQFLWELIGKTAKRQQYFRSDVGEQFNQVSIISGHAQGLLKKISDIGKLHYVDADNLSYGFRPQQEDLKPCHYEEQVWSLSLVVRKSESSGYELTTKLQAEDGRTADLKAIRGFISDFIFFKEGLAKSNFSEHQVWVQATSIQPLMIAESEIDAFLNYFFSLKASKPAIQLPESLQFIDEIILEPKPRVSFEVDKVTGNFATKLDFQYGASIAPSFEQNDILYDIVARKKTHRNMEFERNCINMISDLGAIPSSHVEFVGEFEVSQFSMAVEKLIEYGWDVLVKEQRVTIGRKFQMELSSGIDWFDLKAEFDFEGQSVGLPLLLMTLKSGDRLITLGDGRTGILPEAWVQKLTPLLGMAQQTESGLRLTKVQTLFLNSYLEVADNLKEDKKVKTFREIIETLRTMKPSKADAKFKGILRDYQQAGLTWLKTITDHELGGILADDMGLGKTIQILALLSRWKKMRSSESLASSRLPSLVVAPKSLVFNWQAEAAKFTPHLKVGIYYGDSRTQIIGDIQKYDLIIATYQTIRIDIEKFKNLDFEYLILDEAHYVKNSKAQMSMAVRLLRAKKKIALTGTPVENSLLDLFSILSIVTPVLISDSQADRWAKESDHDKIKEIGKALAPFLLRRTKDQVLKDLPEKTEQVLYCELSPVERAKYKALKQYYWDNLTGKIQEKGLAKSKIEVLEAILRLRQAACHQGLLDKKLVGTPSSKFEFVLEQLETILTEKRKVLVFSQFTSLLKLFSVELGKRKINFEYLDGQTEDRKERVENFNNNDACQVFLLSLKAGGVGLNLTAAECVFILDPWWNPAAESQAIDRTHRIGQKNKVFAYKVITKDTIEEKILEMQQNKKAIAQAVVSENSNLLRTLTMQDLRELFS